jgi:polyferredoxin
LSRAKFTSSARKKALAKAEAKLPPNRDMAEIVFKYSVVFVILYILGFEYRFIVNNVRAEFPSSEVVKIVVLSANFGNNVFDFL